jgi:hypothetical protein
MPDDIVIFEQANSKLSGERLGKAFL